MVRDGTTGSLRKEREGDDTGLGIQELSRLKSRSKAVVLTDVL